MILSPLALSLPPSVFHRAAMLLFFITATCFADTAEMGFATSAPVTAEEYCAFLNANAASDPFHFYDEKMARALESTCILRFGAPGSYRYEAKGGGLKAEGEDKKAASDPAIFLSYNDVLQYCAWKNKINGLSLSPQPSAFSPLPSPQPLASSLAPLCGACDEDLKSSSLNFYLQSNNAREASVWDKSDNSFIYASGMAGLLAVFCVAYYEPCQTGNADLWNDEEMGIPATKRRWNFPEEKTALSSATDRRLSTDGTGHSFSEKDIAQLRFQESGAHKDQDSYFHSVSAPISPVQSVGLPGGIDNKSQKDCYLNVALQCLKTIYEHSPREQQEKLISAYPNHLLLQFFQGTFDATIDSKARSLRLSMRPWLLNAPELAERDRSNLGANGYSRAQADPIDSLRALLPQLNMPFVHFRKKRSLIKNGHIHSIDRTELASDSSAAEPYLRCTLSFDSPHTQTMQQLIMATLNRKGHAFFSPEREVAARKRAAGARAHTLSSMNERTELDHPSGYDEILYEDKIIAPVPATFIVNINRLLRDEHEEKKIGTALERIANPIEIPAYLEGQECNLIYEPIAIVCHYGDHSSGHYFYYKKEADEWHEFNDETNIIIDRTNPKEIKRVSLNMQHDSSLVIYAKKNHADNTSEQDD